MALQSVTKIHIAEKEISSFESLDLHQGLKNHHTLTIVCRTDVIEKKDAELAEESKNFLGERITLNINPLNSFSEYKELTFNGIVTGVKNTKKTGDAKGDRIIIEAQSATILADDGPNYASHNETALSEILQKTFEDYDSATLETAFEPINDADLHYSVQHNQSGYQYAQRLAAQYGEWFYYDGQKLVFGNPGVDEVTLTSNVDLKDYQLQLMPLSHNYNYYSKDYLLDEVHTKDAKEITAGADSYAGFVANKANDIYSKESNVWHNAPNGPETKQHLDTSIEIQKKAIEIKQVKITGISDNPGVTLGNIVIINGEKYRVISVFHNSNEIGNYVNRFEAITASFDAYPFTDIMSYPKSESQTAIVKENNDPEGLGRIKVELSWQAALGGTTPWIRIVTPHSGADKGFHFIPELGEEVLVDFEGGNAENPYVLGSLYNGGAKPEGWTTEDNDVKAIRTRSGHTIELNDTDGEEMIKIYDNEGSIIEFNTAEKSLTINATETIDIAAKNINITAEEDIAISAKGDITANAEGDLNLLTKGDATLQADGDATVGATGDATVDSKGDATLSGMGAVVTGKTSAELSSVKVKIDGSAMTEVGGAIVKIN